MSMFARHVVKINQNRDPLAGGWGERRVRETGFVRSSYVYGLGRAFLMVMMNDRRFDRDSSPSTISRSASLE